MGSSLQSIIEAGTKLWLDSIDPELIKQNRARGATGATSNPIIVADLIKTGRFDDRVGELVAKGLDDSAIAWALTDQLVSEAQAVFEPVWEHTKGNDGYVSFELDPLLEDVELGPAHEERVARYVALGKQWAKGHKNRMIKVPATPAGLDALEELTAAGITLNVTLIFSQRQYEAARDAVWRGAQRRGTREPFKSVYSIFVSRVDVYTAKQVPQLGAGQGLVGIVNAKRLWQLNQAFWGDKGLPLQQEIIFASTGVKSKDDPADKYVKALVGGDIQTNPPGTNDLVEAGGESYTAELATMPGADVLADIDEHVDVTAMEQTLMREGLAKFSDPQKALLGLIAEKRGAVAAAG